MKVHEVCLIIAFLLLILFIPGFAHAQDVNNDILISKEEFIKLQQFVASLRKQLDSALKEAQQLADENIAIRECVMKKARQGRATTTCFSACNQLGNNCHQVADES